MSGEPVFTVIIPVFNKWQLTEACLRSLHTHSSLPFNIIVADNASTDETATELEPLGRSLFGERFRCIRFHENRNFGPACNAAAAAAKTTLLFFLNNDTLVMPGWEPPLLDALAEDATLGGVGPLLLYQNDMVQHLGVTFSAMGVAHLYRGVPAEHPLAAKRRNFQAITAAALLMSRDLFFKHEGFFEEYRNGFEDVDLCLRIYSTGKRFSCIPQSRVYHLESQTPGRSKNEIHNSRLYRKRCMRLAKTDVHLFAKADGLVPFIDDLLRIGLRLSDEEEASLAGLTSATDWAHTYKLFAQNPLWLGGRVRMAEALERLGKYEEASVLRYEIAFILESEQAYRDLLHTAVRGGVEAQREFAEENLKKILGFKKNKGLATAMIDSVLQKASLNNDSELSEMYIKKYQAWFPEIDSGEGCGPS